MRITGMNRTEPLKPDTGNRRTGICGGWLDHEWKETDMILK